MKKYLKIHDLILAFVWHLDARKQPDTFALTCDEAVAIADAMGWTGTASWNEKGGYSTTKPSPELCKRLEPHRMTADLWWTKVTGIQKGAA